MGAAIEETWLYLVYNLVLPAEKAVGKVSLNFQTANKFLL